MRTQNTPKLKNLTVSVRKPKPQPNILRHEVYYAFYLIKNDHFRVKTNSIAIQRNNYFCYTHHYQYQDLISFKPYIGVLFSEPEQTQPTPISMQEQYHTIKNDRSIALKNDLLKIVLILTKLYCLSD